LGIKNNFQQRGHQNQREEPKKGTKPTEYQIQPKVFPVF